MKIYLLAIIAFVSLTSLLLGGCQPKENKLRSKLEQASDFHPYLNADSVLQSWQSFRIGHQAEAALFILEKVYPQNTKQALVYVEKALLLSNKIGENHLIAESYYWVAFLKKRYRFFGEGTYEPLADAKMAASIFQNLNETIWLAKTQNLIGIIEENRDSVHSARKYLNQALQSIATTNTPEAIRLEGEIYHDLGTTYFYEDTVLMMSFFRQAQEKYQLTNNLPAQARLELDFAKCYKKNKDLAKAQSYFTRSLDYANIHDDLDLKINVYEGLIGLRRLQYEALADKEIYADSLFEQGLEYGQKMQNLMQESLFRPYKEQGKLHHLRWYYLNDTIDLQMAFQYYQRAFLVAAEEGEIRVMADMVENIAGLKWDAPQSFVAQVDDWLAKEQRLGYEKILEQDKKNQSIADQRLREFDLNLFERENQLQRTRILAVAGILFFLTALLFSLFYQKAIRQRLEAKIEALRAQINPHFVSNTINAIEGLVNRDKKAEASEALADFAQLMRSILKGSRKGKHSLEQERRMLQNYLELLKLRFEEKFSYEIKIDALLKPEQIYLPPMVVQPFVENAILHGINAMEGNGRLSIRFFRRDPYLFIEVEDDGVGRATSRTLQSQSVLDHESYGMAITRERIEAISRSRGTKIEIVDKVSNGVPAGTLVQIRLSLKEDNTR